MIKVKVLEFDDDNKLHEQEVEVPEGTLIKDLYKDEMVKGFYKALEEPGELAQVVSEQVMKALDTLEPGAAESWEFFSLPKKREETMTTTKDLYRYRLKLKRLRPQEEEEEEEE